MEHSPGSVSHAGKHRKGAVGSCAAGVLAFLILLAGGFTEAWIAFDAAGLLASLIGLGLGVFALGGGKNRPEVRKPAFIGVAISAVLAAIAASNLVGCLTAT